MESVLAAGILRHAADAIRSGKGVDTALREASRGASKSVRELILAHIERAIPKKREVNPNIIRDAILAAAGALS